MVKEYKDWLFVKVPGGAYDIRLEGRRLFLKLRGLKDNKELNEDPHLPFGSWQIIGKGDEIDWEGIVESHEFANRDNWARTDLWYKDYETKEYKWLATPTESGHSLLKSLGMEPGTCLVLKKQTKLK